MLHTRRALLSGAIFAVLSIGALGSIPAQAAHAHREQAKMTAAIDPITDSRGTAVVYPIIFDGSGTRTSRQSAADDTRQVLQTAGFTLISDTVAANTWNRLGLSIPTEVSPANLEDLVRFGKAVHADYVVSGKFHFHSRSIWVDLGPKTVSKVTADMIVIDVNQNKIAYSKMGVSGRSDTRGKVTDLAPLLTLSPPVEAMVSGGPKTPHEQRAAAIAVEAALYDWLKPVQISRK